MLLTTHYMFEADALCDRIAVIANGQIVAEGTPQELKSGVADGSVVEVEVFGVEERIGRAAAGARRVRAVTVEDREQKQLLIVQTAPGLELTHAILSAARRRLRSVGSPRASRRSRTRTWRSSPPLDASRILILQAPR